MGGAAQFLVMEKLPSGIVESLTSSGLTLGVENLANLGLWRV
jgi:hypothetical protein